MVSGERIPKNNKLDVDNVYDIIGPQPGGDLASSVYNTILNKIYGILERGVEPEVLRKGIGKRIGECINP